MTLPLDSPQSDPNQDLRLDILSTAFDYSPVQPHLRVEVEDSNSFYTFDMCPDKQASQRNGVIATVTLSEHQRGGWIKSDQVRNSSINVIADGTVTYSEIDSQNQKSEPILVDPQRAIELLARLRPAIQALHNRYPKNRP